MTTLPPLAIERHYQELSEKDTNAVVEAVADLVVSFLKANPDAGRTALPANSEPKTRRPKKGTCA